MIRVLFCTLIAVVSSQLLASAAVNPASGLAKLSSDLHVGYLHSFLSPAERQQFARTNKRNRDYHERYRKTFFPTTHDNVRLHRITLPRDSITGSSFVLSTDSVYGGWYSEVVSYPALTLIDGLTGRVSPVIRRFDRSKKCFMDRWSTLMQVEPVVVLGKNGDYVAVTWKCFDDAFGIKQLEIYSRKQLFEGKAEPIYRG